MRIALLAAFLLALSGCQGSDPAPIANTNVEEPTTSEPPERSVEDLARDLATPDNEARGSWAAGKLAERAAKGEPGVQVLIDALKHPDEQVRQRAASVLPSAGDKAIPGIAKAVRRPETADAALAVLKRMNQERVMEALTPLLDDPEAAVRLQVLKTLRQLKILSGSRAAQAVAQLLTDPNAEVQLSALEVVSKIGASPEDIPGLLVLFVHSPPKTRVLILSALARIGPAAQNSPKLIEKLTLAVKDDPEPEVRAAAAAALAKASPPADPAILHVFEAALSDKDAQVRAEAVHGLGVVVGSANEKLATSLLPALSALVNDPSPAVRVRVAQVLDQWALPASLNVVAQLLKDSDNATRAQAASALGGLKKGAAPLINEALRSPYPEVRRGALQALDKSSEDIVTKAVPILNDLLAPKEPGRQEVAEFIAKFGPPAAQTAPALTKLLDDPVPAVRRAAVTALGNLDKAGAPGLAMALSSEDADLRLLAIRTLRDMKKEGEAAVPALGKLLKDPNPGVQAEAVLALGDIASEDPEVARGIAELAREKTQRDTCFAALKNMGGPGADALAGLLNDASNKSLVQESLAALRDMKKTAVPSLIQALKNTGNAAFVREGVAKNLGEVGDPTAVDALNDASKDSDPRVSKAAKDALQKIR